MKYSVVMPSYNVEAYIENAVDDILNQSYGDFELILVDDRATDSTPLLCDKLKEKDTRIKVLHKPKNEGLSMARNSGMELATGDYILFLDPDDRYSKSLLEEIEKSLSKSKADVVLYGLTEKYINKAGETYYEKEIVSEEMFSTDITSIRKKVIQLEINTLFGYAWNKAYNLSKIREKNLKFETVTMIEDVVFNIQIFKEIESLNIINKSLYDYGIRNNGSLTQKYLPDYFETHERRVREILYLYKTWNMATDSVKVKLGNIYCRYLLSAIQRNCSPKAKMTHSNRKDFIKKQFQSQTYIELQKYIRPDNKILKITSVGISHKNVTYCLMVGRFMYIVKNKFPSVFSRLKQNR